MYWRAVVQVEGGVPAPFQSEQVSSRGEWLLVTPHTCCYETHTLSKQARYNGCLALNNGVNAHFRIFSLKSGPIHLYPCSRPSSLQVVWRMQ